MLRSRALPAWLVAGAAVVSAILPGAANGQDLPLRYAQAYSSLRSVFSLPISVAERVGFFRREKVDFHLVVPIPGGSDKMIDALEDGTADVTHIATPFLIRRALAGSDAVAVMAEFNNPIYSLIAKPEIKTISELKGKLIGLANETGTITIATRKLLTLRGLRPHDFRFKIIEGTPARYNCLKRGECDAVPLGQPHDLQALKEGYRLLGLSTEAVPEFVYTVTAVRRSWAAGNKESLVRYLRALGAAFKFIRDPANRTALVKIMVETTESNPDVAEQTLRLFFEPERNVLPLRGEINMTGLSQVISFMAEAGTIQPPLPPPGRFVDLQYFQLAGLK
jgi:ABC-type nitrate/sulfonate/bicarbonate transport system substrate-binding protein